MKRSKQNALELLKQKINGEIKITYQEIANKSNYSLPQIKRLSRKIEKKDIETLLVHELTGKNSNNSAPDQEIEYIKEFKKQYPSISISQFQDIYHEDVIFNKNKQDDVKKYNLRKRSKSFFQQLYKREGWKSPIKHKCFKYDKDVHSLREPSPRRGMLIMTNGTPHDWFQNGNPFSLHQTLDDATGEILSGWFTKNECQLGYCMAFKIMFEKYGIPQAIYADRTTILWDPKDGSLTQVGRMLDELGIELIFANTPEAKGKVEKMNCTIQNRLLNDIKRFNIKTYDELNQWFNSFYIGYINNKFSYEPKEEETEFIPLGNTDSFKVTKTGLSGRPVWVGLEEHIQSHFLTCFIALVIIRLLENRLNNKYSFQAIIDAIRNYTSCNVDHDIYMQSFKNDVIDSFEHEFDIELSKKFKTLSEIKKILG